MLIFGWQQGGDALILPDNVGIPLGAAQAQAQAQAQADSAASYDYASIIIQVHYDHPGLGDDGEFL